MARCGCSGTCSCRITPGDGMTVTGTGTPDDPYVVTNTGAADAQAALDEANAALVAASAVSNAELLLAARSPDSIVNGAVTRDANSAATSAPVKWPDGTVGTYTADTLSTAFPGAVDGYHVTYGSPVTKTYTQPTITRDSTTGAATNVPAIVVT